VFEEFTKSKSKPPRGLDEFCTTNVIEFDEPAFTVVAPVKLMVVFVGVPL
jgi:hypothetical protein